MRRYPSGIAEVGKCYNRTAVTVTQAAQEIALTAGRKTIEITPSPTEDEEIYYGGSGVTSANGAPIGAGKFWAECKTGFSIYLICESGKTANVRITEYD